MNVHELFPSRWLSGHDLNGKAVTVTIARVTLEDVRTPAGEQAVKPCVWFEKAQKGLLLNKTNALAIAKLHGPETDSWLGKPVTLQAATIHAFGDEHCVVRIANGK